MKVRCDLPGAEKFVDFLIERVDGILSAEGPVCLDHSWGVEYTKEWKVLVDGREIGKYRTYGPKPEDEGVSREYHGRVPGYVNEAIAISDERKPQNERRRLDEVSLSYSNKRFEAEDMRYGPGKIVETPWQRQDGHTDIPF